MHPWFNRARQYLKLAVESSAIFTGMKNVILKEYERAVEAIQCMGWSNSLQRDPERPLHDFANEATCNGDSRMLKMPELWGICQRKPNAWSGATSREKLFILQSAELEV